MEGVSVSEVNAVSEDDVSINGREAILGLTRLDYID